MSTVVTRAAKGSPLTNAEVDSNFTNLNTDKAELSGAVFTGAITTNSTIDGRDVATDGTKLDTVETNADITDATNVTAAGALMDSEVTNLAQVKAFDSSDYATAAQGTKADASLPKAGGAMTGAITTNSTFDGRDVSVDGAKLDGVEASADVTDVTNVTASGALMDSEVTNLAQVKAFDSTDYATSTQGSTADAALPKTGGAMTGAITTNSTFDGRDVAADGVTADAALPKSGGAMTGAITTNSTFDGVDIATRDGVLSTTTTTANAALPKSGGAMTGAITTNSTFDGVDVGTRDAVLTSTTTTANAALPKAGGTMTGALIVNETTAVTMSAGTTAQRPTGVAGMFRYNTTEDKFEGYSTTWGEIGGGAADLRVNSFTGNGSTTAYTLTTSPDLSNTLAYIDGVYQVKAAYAMSGQVLTFTAAPDSGALIEITAATVAPVQESTDFLLNQYTGDGSTAFTLSAAPTNENQCSVFISGVYQSKANFSVSGSTLTFSTAPPNGSAIEVMCARTVVFSAGTPDDNTVSTVKIQDDAVTSAKVDSTVATVAGTETLTNKTLTAPTINGGTHTAFTSTGIDDNATSIALTIDASENILVGKTSSSYAVEGIALRGDNAGVSSTVTDETCFTANRLNSHGRLMLFAKDTVTVGSIGTYEGTTVVAGKYTGLKFNYSNATNSVIHTVSPSGVVRDAVDDLGYAGSRFKDLYLSGGVVFGPASASNVSSQTLDSYEEGTFTCSLAGTTGQPSPVLTTTGSYTKIGKIVNFTFAFENINTTGYSGHISFQGLPFTSSSTVTARTPVNVLTYLGATIDTNAKSVKGNITSGGSTVIFLYSDRSNDAYATVVHNARNTVYFWGSGTYQTDQ